MPATASSMDTPGVAPLGDALAPDPPARPHAPPDPPIPAPPSPPPPGDVGGGSTNRHTNHGRYQAEPPDTPVAPLGYALAPDPPSRPRTPPDPPSRQPTPPPPSVEGGEAHGGGGSSYPAPRPTPTPTTPPKPDPTALPAPNPTATRPPNSTALPTLNPTAAPTSHQTTPPEPYPTAPPTPSPTATPSPNPAAATTPSAAAHPTRNPTDHPGAAYGHTDSTPTAHKRPYKRLPVFLSLSSAPTLATLASNLPRPFIRLAPLKPHILSEPPIVATPTPWPVDSPSPSPEMKQQNHQVFLADSIAVDLRAKFLREKTSHDEKKLWLCFAGWPYLGVPPGILVCVTFGGNGMGTLVIAVHDADNTPILFLDAQRGPIVKEYPGPVARTSCINKQSIAQAQAAAPNATPVLVAFVALAKHLARAAKRAGIPIHEPSNNLSPEDNAKYERQADAFEASLNETGFSEPVGAGGAAARPVAQHSPPKSDEKRPSKRGRLVVEPTPVMKDVVAVNLNPAMKDVADASAAEDPDMEDDAAVTAAPDANGASEAAAASPPDGLAASPPEGPTIPTSAPTVSPDCVADGFGEDSARIAAADRVIAAASAASAAAAIAAAAPAPAAPAPAPPAAPAATVAAAAAAAAAHPDPPHLVADDELRRIRHDAAEARAAQKTALALLRADRTKIAELKAENVDLRLRSESSARGHDALRERFDALILVQGQKGAPVAARPAVAPPVEAQLNLKAEQEFNCIFDPSDPAFNPAHPVRPPNDAEIDAYAIAKSHARLSADPSTLWAHPTTKITGLTTTSGRKENASAILSMMNEMPSVLHGSARFTTASFATIDGVVVLFIESAVTYGGLALFDGIVMAAGGLDPVLDAIARTCAPNVLQRPRRVTPAGFPAAPRWAAMSQHQRLGHVISTRRDRLMKYKSSARRTAPTAANAYA